MQPPHLHQPTSFGQALIELPATIYRHPPRVTSDGQTQRYSAGEMTDSINSTELGVPCEQHADGSHFHHLDCDHIVETRYREECGKSCRGISSWPESDLRCDNTAETDKSPAPLPCTACAEDSIDWDAIEFKWFIQDSSLQNDCAERSPLDRITGLKEALVLKRAAFEAQLNGSRFCEMVSHPEDTMDWGERLKDIHIGTVDFLRTEKLFLRPMQQLLPPASRPGLPAWINELESVPVTKEPIFNCGSVKKGKPILNIWHVAASRHTREERMAEVIEHEEDLGPEYKPPSRCATNTTVKKASDSGKLMTDAGEIPYRDPAREVVSQSTDDVSEESIPEDAPGFIHTGAEQAAELQTTITEAPAGIGLYRHGARRKRTSVLLPPEPRRAAEWLACGSHERQTEGSPNAVGVEESGRKFLNSNEDMQYSAGYGERFEMAIAQEAMHAGHIPLRRPAGHRIGKALSAIDVDEAFRILAPLPKNTSAESGPRCRIQDRGEGAGILRRTSSARHAKRLGRAACARGTRESTPTSSEAAETAHEATEHGVSAERLLPLTAGSGQTLETPGRGDPVCLRRSMSMKGKRREAGYSVIRTNSSACTRAGKRNSSNPRTPASTKPSSDGKVARGRAWSIRKIIIRFFSRMCCCSSLIRTGPM